MASPGQKCGNCGHVIATFDQHSKCARCRDEGLGTDPCVLKKDCQICNCIPGAKRGYYGFIIVVVRVVARIRRDFLLVTYSPHFFPDFFHIWQVA